MKKHKIYNCANCWYNHLPPKYLFKGPRFFRPLKHIIYCATCSLSVDKNGYYDKSSNFKCPDDINGWIKIKS